MSSLAINTFTQVVAAVNSRYDGEVYSMYGHAKEINRRLLEKDKDSVFKYQKYPLIALSMPFSEEITGNRASVATMNIAVMHYTETTYISEERYQQVIVPILEPLYNMFLEELIFHPAVQNIENPPHTRIDRLFWSSSDQKEERKFSDPLDAIELINLQLRLINTIC